MMKEENSERFPMPKWSEVEEFIKSEGEDPDELVHGAAESLASWNSYWDMAKAMSDEAWGIEMALRDLGDCVDGV